MSYAYRFWLEKTNSGDKLPRGHFFRHRHKLMKELTRHIHIAHHYLYLSRLNDGFSHYLDIIGLSDIHTTEPDELERDRQRFSHLIRKDLKGKSVFIDTDCAKLMDEVWNTGYEESLCFARLHRPDR